MARNTIAEIYSAEDKEQAAAVVREFARQYCAKFPKAVASAAGVAAACGEERTVARGLHGSSFRISGSSANAGPSTT